MYFLCKAELMAAKSPERATYSAAFSGGCLIYCTSALGNLLSPLRGENAATVLKKAQTVPGLEVSRLLRGLKQLPK